MKFYSRNIWLTYVDTLDGINIIRRQIIVNRHFVDNFLSTTFRRQHFVDKMFCRQLFRRQTFRRQTFRRQNISSTRHFVDRHFVDRHFVDRHFVDKHYKRNYRCSKPPICLFLTWSSRLTRIFSKKEGKTAAPRPSELCCCQSELFLLSDQKQGTLDVVPEVDLFLVKSIRDSFETHECGIFVFHTSCACSCFGHRWNRHYDTGRQKSRQVPSMVLDILIEVNFVENANIRGCVDSKE